MKIAGTIIILVGMLLLAGCSFQLRSLRGAKGAPVLQEGELVTTHIVKDGETLWKIAGYPHIYGDPYKWKQIYEANKDVLEGPDSLKLGQVLIIPQE